MNSHQVEEIIDNRIKNLKNSIAALEAIVKGYKIAMVETGVDISTISSGIIMSEAVLGLNEDQREIVKKLLL